LKDTYAARKNEQTLETATNHKQRWSSEEVAFIETFCEDSTVEEIAISLGRSYHGTASKKVEQRILNEAKHNGVNGIVGIPKLPFTKTSLVRNGHRQVTTKYDMFYDLEKAFAVCNALNDSKKFKDTFKIDVSGEAFIVKAA